MSLGGGSSSPQQVKESPLEKELAKIAVSQWGDFQEIYIPLENKHIEDVKEFGSEKEKGKARGYAAATVQSTAFTPEPTRDSGGPNSGEFYSSLRDASTITSKRLSAGLTDATFNADSRRLAGLSDIVRVGRNIQNESSANLGTAAGLQQSEQISQLEQQRGYTESLYGGIGTAAGIGLSSVGKQWLQS